MHWWRADTIEIFHISYKCVVVHFVFLLFHWRSLNRSYSNCRCLQICFGCFRFSVRKWRLNLLWSFSFVKWMNSEKCDSSRLKSRIGDRCSLEKKKMCVRACDFVLLLFLLLVLVLKPTSVAHMFDVNQRMNDSMGHSSILRSLVYSH